MIKSKLVAYIEGRLKGDKEQVVFSVPTPPNIRSQVARALVEAATQINSTDRSKITADYLYMIIGAAISAEGLDTKSSVAQIGGEVVVRFFVEMALEEGKMAEPLVMFARVPKPDSFKERVDGSDEATVKRLLKRRKAV